MSKRLCVKKLCAPAADPVEVLSFDVERPAAAAEHLGNEHPGPSARLLQAQPAEYPNGKTARLPYRLRGPGCPYRSSRWPQSRRPRTGVARGSAPRPGAVAAQATAAATVTWMANSGQCGSRGMFWYASHEVPGAGYLRGPACTRDIRSPVGVRPPIPIIPICRAAFRRGNAGCCTTTGVLSLMRRSTIPGRAWTPGALRPVPSPRPWTGHCRYRTSRCGRRPVSGAAPDTLGHPT